MRKLTKDQKKSIEHLTEAFKEINASGEEHLGGLIDVAEIKNDTENKIKLQKEIALTNAEWEKVAQDMIDKDISILKPYMDSLGLSVRKGNGAVVLQGDIQYYVRPQCRTNMVACVTEHTGVHRTTYDYDGNLHPVPSLEHFTQHPSIVRKLKKEYEKVLKSKNQKQ